MKTITKKYQVYTFDELSQEAKDKARAKYNEDNDYPFLTDDLREYIHEELKDRGIEVLGISTSANPSIRPLYDLSYCQGSGLMFEATLEYKGHQITIKQRGCRGTFPEFTYDDFQGEAMEELENKIAEEFEAIYNEICDTVKLAGYKEIEYQGSEECFRETCEANEYNFLEDGTMVNY